MFLKRLSLGNRDLVAEFQCRLFLLVPTLIFGVLGRLMRASCALPGSLGRFLPCGIGANHCRELLALLRYPPRSATALLDGVLPLRYCAVRFASKVPTWRLPPCGNVAGLLTNDCEDVGIVRVVPGAVVSTGDHVVSHLLHDAGVDWLEGLGKVGEESD